MAARARAQRSTRHPVPQPRSSSSGSSRRSPSSSHPTWISSSSRLLPQLRVVIEQEGKEGNHSSIMVLIHPYIPPTKELEERAKYMKIVKNRDTGENLANGEFPKISHFLQCPAAPAAPAACRSCPCPCPCSLFLYSVLWKNGFFLEMDPFWNLSFCGAIHSFGAGKREIPKWIHFQEKSSSITPTKFLAAAAAAAATWWRRSSFEAHRGGIRHQHPTSSSSNLW